jgi:hypothetical protein
MSNYRRESNSGRAAQDPKLQQMRLGNLKVTLGQRYSVASKLCSDLCRECSARKDKAAEEAAKNGDPETMTTIYVDLEKGHFQTAASELRAIIEEAKGDRARYFEALSSPFVLEFRNSSEPVRLYCAVNKSALDTHRDKAVEVTLH